MKFTDADAGNAFESLANAGWHIHTHTQSDREVGPEGYCVVVVSRGTEARSFVSTFHNQSLVAAWVWVKENT